MAYSSNVESSNGILADSDSKSGKIVKGGRRLGRRVIRKLGIRSYVKADGFWWYRWHSDVGIALSNTWEKQISHEILRPGGCFVDAGSHVGRWTIRASAFYQRIIAFEPDQFTNNVLRRNIERNNIQNVKVFQIALSNRRGNSMLYSYGPLACRSLRQTHVSGNPQKIGKLVPVNQLDDFMEHFLTPMVIKIDVEGEELALLEGGTKTLETFQPTVIVEVHFEGERKKVVDELNKRGYVIIKSYPDIPQPRGIVFMVARPNPANLSIR